MSCGSCFSMQLQMAHSAQAAGGASVAALLITAQALLELWDGVCAYFSAQAKPAAWTAMLLKALRLVRPETRAAAAAAAQVLPAWCQEAHMSWNNLSACHKTCLNHPQSPSYTHE